MTKPKLPVTKIGSHTLLALTEPITFQKCAELEASIKDVSGKNQKSIIFDCKGVGFMDSAALEMLLRLQANFKEQGCILKLIGLNALCRDILTVTRLTNQIHIYSDLREATRESL